MENAGRRDITSQAEETSAVELSHNLTTVTTEIKTYQSIGGQAIFEIGRRLKWVKENDLAHGEYVKWLESIKLDRSTANKFIKVSDNLPNVETFLHSGVNALYEIATMPPEERDRPQPLDSGETKKPDEMTVRELRETKRKLAAAYSENVANQTLLTQADKKAQKLQAQVTKLQQRDPDIKQVEVEPADYQDTKADLKAANEKIADLQKLVDDAVDDHNQRLAYELELEKAKADLNDLEVKRQNMLKQNAQIREVQKMVKSINELLDNFAILRNRLDTTMLPDESSLVQGLTEMADKLIENGQVLHDDLAHPYRG